MYVRWIIRDAWEARLLAAKARLNKEKTTLRSELNGLVITCRLITALIDGMRQKPWRTTIIGDSECTISSCEAKESVLNQWFVFRVGEIVEHREKWKKFC